MEQIRLRMEVQRLKEKLEARSENGSAASAASR
jgi:hypothetical protein